MNRKQFIQSLGAECDNWTWSWSFINHDDQMVIFGAWDIENEHERAVILREGWEYNQGRVTQAARLHAGHQASQIR